MSLIGEIGSSPYKRKIPARFGEHLTFASPYVRLGFCYIGGELSASVCLESNVQARRLRPLLRCGSVKEFKVRCLSRV